MSVRWPLVCFLVPILTACGAADPASELRDLIESTEMAAEERRTSHFRALLSESYTDARGNDRERMIDIVRGYFLTHQSLNVITRIESIELIGADVAEVSLVAGVLGQRAGASLLGGLEGQLYDLELELVRDGGDWRIIGARWKRSLEIWDGD